MLTLHHFNRCKRVGECVYECDLNSMNCSIHNSFNIELIIALNLSFKVIENWFSAFGNVIDNPWCLTFDGHQPHIFAHVCINTEYRCQKTHQESVKALIYQATMAFMQLRMCDKQSEHLCPAVVVLQILF